jgi:hypothetical protein
MESSLYFGPASEEMDHGGGGGGGLSRLLSVHVVGKLCLDSHGSLLLLGNVTL